MHVPYMHMVIMLTCKTSRKNGDVEACYSYLVILSVILEPDTVWSLCLILRVSS